MGAEKEGQLGLVVRPLPRARGDVAEVARVEIPIGGEVEVGAVAGGG